MKKTIRKILIAAVVLCSCSYVAVAQTASGTSSPAPVVPVFQPITVVTPSATDAAGSLKVKIAAILNQNATMEVFVYKQLLGISQNASFSAVDAPTQALVTGSLAEIKAAINAAKPGTIQ